MGRGVVLWSVWGCIRRSALGGMELRVGWEGVEIGEELGLEWEWEWERRLGWEYTFAGGVIISV